MTLTTIDELIRLGHENAVALFHRAAGGIAAYSDFLKRHAFDPKSVNSPADFQRVPISSKENYIERYPLEELVWNRNLGNATMIHSSSGTSGKPYYWPCTDEELKRSMTIYETVFRGGFDVGGKYQKTLLVVCFGMGTWIAGSYTTAATMLLRLQGLPVTIVTPGFNRLEALGLMHDLGLSFDQVILAGIPSFIKDLLDEWSQIRPNNFPRIGVLLAGEGFPESWRDHVAGAIGGDSHDVISLLGSADAGLIGFESEQSIALRKSMVNDESLRRSLLHSDRVPGVLHFDPCHRFLEASNSGQLLLTADRTIPLIRYDTMDVGGILPSSVLQDILPTQRDDQAKVNLPLMYLFGRGTKSATLYGANIHAEWIQEFLVESRVSECTSGRFCLETGWLANQNQQLVVRFELAREFNPIGNEDAAWAESLAKLLRSRSTEYARICQEYGERADPKITLHPYASSEYFPAIQRKCS